MAAYGELTFAILPKNHKKDRKAWNKGMTWEQMEMSEVN